MNDTPTLIPERLALLDELTLDSGAHDGPADRLGPEGAIRAGEACVMEAVAFVAGEPWSDHPDCASKVIGAFLRGWNDSLDDDGRQALKPYIARLVGSAGTPEQEDARAWMAMDWLVRSYTPAWLRLAGLTHQAAALEQLSEMRAGMDVPSIRPVIEVARKDADAAGDAAWATAWATAGAAAWAAAWDAAGDAARAAARAAARDAAWAAARDAAGAAAGDAAGAAAWDAARATAWATAWAAARAAAWAAARAAARDAARDAAGDALAPTVTEIQGLAHQLVERMLAVTETQEVQTP